METVEVPMLRMPCGHLHDRPDPPRGAVFACVCGRMWNIAWDGTGTWTARSV